MSKKVTIDEFIDIVHPKLNMPVFFTYDTMKGVDLKLAGHKEFKGQPIEDHVLYKYPVPTERVVDHKFKMRLAFLRGGKQALETYVQKNISKRVDMKKLMSVL